MLRYRYKRGEGSFASGGRRGSVRREGLSLLEVLVACGVSSILLLVLAQSLKVSGDLWSGGRSRSDTRRIVRAVQDRVRGDLLAVALPTEGRVVSGRGDLQFLINPSTVTTPYRNADAAFWQAPIATDSSEGRYAELGYFVQWIGRRAILTRHFLNPSESRTLLGGSDLFQRVYNHPGNWVNDDVLKASSPADLANHYRGYFAENVIGFWMRPLNAAGALAYNNGLDGFDSNLAFQGAPPPVLPAAIEVSFVVLEPNVANRLMNWSDANAVIDKFQTFYGKASAVDPATSSAAAAFVSEVQTSNLKPEIRNGVSAHQMTINLR